MSSTESLSDENGLSELSRSIARHRLGSAQPLSEMVFGSEELNRPGAELIGATSLLGPHSIELQWIEKV